MLLALGPVDLLQAEEPPAHVNAELLTHIPDPQRGLIGPRAHDVEVEVDGADRTGGWLSRHAASAITAPAECPRSTCRRDLPQSAHRSGYQPPIWHQSLQSLLD